MSRKSKKKKLNKEQEINKSLDSCELNEVENVVNVVKSDNSLIDTLSTLEKLFDVYNKVPAEVKLILWELSKIVYRTILDNNSFKIYSMRYIANGDSDSNEIIGPRNSLFKSDFHLYLESLRIKKIDDSFEDVSWIRTIDYSVIENDYNSLKNYPEDFKKFILLMSELKVLFDD